MKHFLKSLKVKKAVHGSESLTHLAYCALVFVEGHSLYAYAAGALAVLIVIGALLHVGGEEV